MHRVLRCVLPFTAALAAPALAAEGVLEINQTCAVQTGCFPGDNPGFPVEITTPGTSYKLTGPLVVPDENTDGIEVTASSVSLDLNGFEIARSGCVGATESCVSETGSGFGVNGPVVGLSVSNGSVIGMGQYGVRIGSNCHAKNLRLRWNRRGGLVGDSGNVVESNTAYRNGDDGIYLGAGSVVSGNAVWGNGFDGIFVSQGSVVSDNSVYDNGFDGIQSSGGSLIQGNAVLRNGGYGLALFPTDTYRDNAITTRDPFSVFTTVVSGVNAGGNSCNGNTACP